jgi:hypothetical protein
MKLFRTLFPGANRRPRRSLIPAPQSTGFPRGLLVALILAAMGLPAGAVEKPVLRAGAVAVDITPTVLPSPLGNGWKKQLVGRVHDPLWARALVLDEA